MKIQHYRITIGALLLTLALDIIGDSEVHQTKSTQKKIDSSKDQSRPAISENQNRAQSKNTNELDSNFPVKAISHPLIGKHLPNFSMTNLNGQVEHLNSFRGKVLLIHFWATWCPPCRSEFKALQNLYLRYSGKPYNILAISHDVARKEIDRFLENRDINFPIYFDPYTVANFEIFKQVTPLPLTILVNSSGKVEYIFWGPQKWDENLSIFNKINELLP